MILSPEIAFTGDTTAEYMLDPRNADALRAKVLITEVGFWVLLALLCIICFTLWLLSLYSIWQATFLDESFSTEHAQSLGHTHISQVWLILFLFKTIVELHCKRNIFHEQIADHWECKVDPEQNCIVDAFLISLPCRGDNSHLTSCS